MPSTVPGAGLGCATTTSPAEAVVLSTDGVQRLAVGLRAGALPAVTLLEFNSMHVRDAGASA